MKQRINPKEIHSVFRRTPLEVRRRQGQNILKKHEGRIPIILGLPQNSQLIIPKTKLLAKKEIKVREFLLKVHSNSKIPKDKTLFLYSKKKLLNPQMVLNKIYEKYAGEDGFLYLTLSEMSSLG